jgi:hypothetical protein
MLQGKSDGLLGGFGIRSLCGGGTQHRDQAPDNEALPSRGLIAAGPLEVIAVFSSGTTAFSIGMDGLYLATSLAVVPPLARTKMSDALEILAVRTSDS